MLGLQKLTHERPPLLADAGQRIAHAHDRTAAFGSRARHIDETDVRPLRQPRVADASFCRAIVGDDPGRLDSAVAPGHEGAAALFRTAEDDRLPAGRPPALAFR